MTAIARIFCGVFLAELPYYSFNWGNAHFAVIDGDIANVSTSKLARDEFWGRQTRWLEEDLAGSQESDYRFVMAHHPPFKTVERGQGDNPHTTALTAGLCGHDHNYQHYLEDGPPTWSAAVEHRSTS